MHPEAYPVVERIIVDLNKSIKEIMGDNRALQRPPTPVSYTDERFGLPTVQDIFKELEKPGRDPRPEFKTATFTDGVEKVGDLRPGMILEGVVTNVAALAPLSTSASIRMGWCTFRRSPIPSSRTRTASSRPAKSSRSRCWKSTCNAERIALTMRMSDEPTQGKRSENSPASRGQQNAGRPRPGGSTPAPSGNAMAAAFAKLKR